jgi:hypothetical protein
LLLRRILPPAAAAFALACAPSIQQDPAPASVSYAVFDPNTSQIPLPNDLAILPSTLATFPAGAQKDLLTAFATQGGFPNDQEVDVTIDFTTLQINADGSLTPVAPDLDLATISDTTLRMLRLPGTPVSFATPVAADYVKGAGKGTLTLRNVKDAKGNGPLPWPSSASGAAYVVGVRGGASGVKLVGGGTINPSSTFFLLTRGVDLSLEENQSLIPGSRTEKMDLGKQLETLRQNYQVPFSALATSIPTAELAVLTAFHIAPTNVAVVETDPGRGLIPIPSDFLLDPATGNKTVQPLAAFGPLAPGIATLDGFSTTGPIIATLSDPVQASTITKDTVYLYDMSNPAAPVRVPDATEAGGGYVTEPSALTQTVNGTAVTKTIGLQPAVPAPGGGTVLALPPLKEATEYVVLISNKVKDLSNKSIGRSTLAQTLLFPPEHPVASNGKSLLAGVSDANATGVEQMRQLLHLAIAKLQSDKGVARDQLVMAYSFRTQSITGTGYALELLAGKTPSKPPGLVEFAAIPYSNPALSTQFVVDPTYSKYDAATAWTKWGLDAYTPNDGIDEVIHATITTLDLESDITGAFDPTILTDAVKTGKALKKLRVLIATPKAANVATTCPAAYGPAAGKACAPLLVFHHGLGGSKASMLAVANEYTKRGFVVAAIDGSKHGDRSWCSADAQCKGGAAGSCVKIAGGANQGDLVAPGICSTGNLKVFTNCSTPACAGAWAAYTDSDGGPDGYARNSSNYFVSANFFRTRDTLRQDLIDQSALILALARPSKSAALPDICNDATPCPSKALLGYLLQGKGLLIDPAHISWAGQSLGAILGTLNLAANPRLARGVLNVGGGTLTDILTTAPAFQGSVGGLLASLGIVPGTPAYLQFLLVAKWILDPADPINAAGHLLGGTSKATLPDLLAGQPNQVAKSIYGQFAGCDQTVPNVFNIGLYGNIGLTPLGVTTQRPNAAMTMFLDVGPASATNTCPDANKPYSIPVAFPGYAGYAAVPHAFITNRGAAVSFDAGGTPSFTTNSTIHSLAQAAGDLGAAFLLDPVTSLPPTAVAFPVAP